jgi:DegV family protein with EDD domain
VIAIVVDSNSQMSPELAARLGVTVVPLVVRIDGTDFHEGVDLDADAFYGHWTPDGAPLVTTSQPSPGAFKDVYERLVADGATEILSVHMGASLSGTLNSAGVAARTVPVPVRLVDTATASFGVSCCAWAAVDAIADGAGLEEAARVAERRAEGLATAFIVGIPELIDRSGRAAGVDVGAAAAVGVPVIGGRGGDLAVLGTVRSVDESIVAMVDYALSHEPTSPAGLRIAVGTSDRSSFAVGAALTERLARRCEVADVVQYRVGPSVGAYTGPGTAGLFVF